jgi:thioredoxin-like negative regulator of GroEL
MSNYPEVFTMFKVDWCPHCNKAAPEWEAMKDEVKATGLPVKVHEVDGDAAPGAVKQAGVSAFPTMIYKKGNNEVKYDGPRDAQSLTNFVKQMVATPAPTLRPSAVPMAVPSAGPAFIPSAAPVAIPSSVALKPTIVPTMGPHA